MNKNTNGGFASLLGKIYQTLKQWLEMLLDFFGKAIERPNKTPPDDTPPNPKRLFAFIALFIVVLVIFNTSNTMEGREISYSQFLNDVKSAKIDKAIVTERFISGTIKPDKANAQPQQFLTVPLWQTDLAKLLQENNVDYVVRSGENWLVNFFLNWVLPILLLVAIWSWMMRRSSGMQRGILNLGNKGQIHPDSLPKVTFNDVAGADSAKQELKEAIDFLKTPDKIHKLGGHMPKGVLLVGPPGTGKTLLARAVAGEAGVPFFNISGSEFIELFVGVGAARVRELFEQARGKAPCIIFIDELDAIGRSRSGPNVMGSHDEREQTLNQLLTEMDGFDTSVGVIVMAATNRPEILDKALLRSGRFDRQIIVDKPDLQDRIEILKLHIKAMTLAADIDATVIAKRTPGLVGADLANIANEAAIIATRLDHKQIEMTDFEAAIDRILAGPEKKNRTLNTEEKRRVAYHEAGHALIAEKIPTGQPVHKISIIPRGVSALGFTLQLPIEEKFLLTENELKDQIAILLGGRIAERIALGNVSTGAQNDLEKASDIARSMVCSLGMSKRMGALTYGKRQQLQFLDSEISEYRNYSDETARILDTEIMALISEGEHRAHEIISENRDILDRLAALLQEKEVVQREEFLALF
ncbi:MAG: ATP-dependent zinc metalloprotease FtsH [Methylovulum sp.]|uniref:ATP-dependent zinc metalloprotease FtsH n=1 Tax=Methylovulum sp. TaxID=1916980 RepID=UPI002630F560|nr:ATP-dependent zinc metalloprotease FtsH [Methylovulum sp.]MDD2722944.1 ATP-dependent zinc metalloprotease FtsH [Methylovulum sp.]MDD5123257.1 ATP-dependent zinc metalloprotease FtsH [Methylovulum sp.]